MKRTRLSKMLIGFIILQLCFPLFTVLISQTAQAQTNYATWPDAWNRSSGWWDLDGMGATYPITFGGYSDVAKINRYAPFVAYQQANGWNGLYEIHCLVASDTMISVSGGDTVYMSAWVWTETSSYGVSFDDLGVSLFADVYTSSARIRELSPRTWCKWGSNGWVQITAEYYIDYTIYADGAGYPTIGYPAGTPCQPAHILPIMQAMTLEGGVNYYDEYAYTYIRDTTVYVNTVPNPTIPAPTPTPTPTPTPVPTGFPTPSPTPTPAPGEPWIPPDYIAPPTEVDTDDDFDIQLNENDSMQFQDLYHSAILKFTVEADVLNGTGSLTSDVTGGTLTVTPTTNGQFTPSLVTGLAFFYLDDEAIDSVFNFTSGVPFELSWIYSGASGPPEIIDFELGGDVGLLLAYLLNGDVIGFLIACYTTRIGQFFYVIVALMFTVPLALRTQSFTYVAIVWVLLAVVFQAAVPVIAPASVLMVILALAALIYRAYTKE